MHNILRLKCGKGQRGRRISTLETLKIERKIEFHEGKQEVKEGTEKWTDLFMLSLKVKMSLAFVVYHLKSLQVRKCHYCLDEWTIYEDVVNLKKKILAGRKRGN